MNASARTSLMVLSLLTLAACTDTQTRVEYDPHKCVQACEVDFRECTKDPVATTERREFCEDQRKRCREFCGEE